MFNKKVISLKKVFLIIISLVCAVSVFAVSYATPYKGSGRSGGIYLSSAAHRSAASMGMVQAPVATMSSTSSINTGVRGVNVTRTMTVAMPAANSVRGIYTAASAVTGGVTTYQTGVHPGKGHIRRDGGSSMDDDDPIIDCTSCVDGNEDGICDRCGCDLFDGCTCAEESGYCWCPLDFNIGAYLFMAVLAAGYALWKKRATQSPEDSAILA